MESMVPIINILSSLILLGIACAVVLTFDNEGKELDTKEPEEVDRICYAAFKGLTDDEFAKLPRSIKPRVPDKCRWCRFAGHNCARFKER